MKKIGYIIIGISFLVGAYLVSINKTQVNWQYYIPFLVLGFVGIALVRISDKKTKKSAEVFEDNLGEIESSLNNLISNLKLMNYPAASGRGI